MYDLSSKFNTFYSSHVVLSQEEQNSLHHKKNLNLQRLKEGLKEYNKDNDTDYFISESCVQGSVAMYTIVQNENNDYDIDVAVVFNKSNIENKTSLAIKRIVKNALSRKTKQFNAEPEIKTSCVRIKYEEGYHIDFAIYRRYYDDDSDCWIYEHAGSDWTKRELRGLTEWFKTQNEESDGKLRKIVRLSKMFCKSRESWKNMPSGLLQTIICDEQLQYNYERIDELFYYSMKEIVNRLESDTLVFAPVDNNRELTSRKSDLTRMVNWKNRLKSKLEDLDILFNPDCTDEDAIQAWYGFFNHDYWSEQINSTSNIYERIRYGRIYTYTDSEQFIEDLYPVNLSYSCSVSCQVSGNGWRNKPLLDFLATLTKYLPHNFEIKCTMVYTNCPKPYKILWKVKNVGPEAERRNQIRGIIKERGDVIVEHSNFFGNHYIECYIIKNEICVARRRINIPIGKGG